MSASALLLELMNAGFELWKRGGALHYRAPEKAFTPALREAMTERKAALLECLPEGYRFVSPSSGQRRLWFLHMLLPDDPLYNMPDLVFHVEGSFSTSIFARCLEEIVARHEILRTVFGEIEGHPLQMIADRMPPPIREMDLSALPLEQARLEAEQQAKKALLQPFDLAAGPLLRVSLWRLSGRETLVACAIHHIIFDGWSLGVFMREFATLYAAFAANSDSPLTEPPPQYREWVVQQAIRREPEWLEREETFWKQRLSSPPPQLNLPLDRPRSVQPDRRGGMIQLKLPAEHIQSLKTVAHGENATLYMVLLAALEALLHRYTNQEDMVLGSIAAGRNGAAFASAIGFFANTLVIRDTVRSHSSFRDHLRAVRKTCLENLSHQDYPFEDIVRSSHPGRDINRNPLFDVMIIQQNMPMPSVDLPGMTWKRVTLDLGLCQTDLAFEFREFAGACTVTAHYRAALFNRDSIERMLEHYQILLEGIARHPDEPIGRLPLLGETERRQLLEEWNATAKGYPPDARLHRLFEAQVARTPDRIALLFEHTAVTYRELNIRANQLAYALRALGVVPDTLVGVYMERSIEMVVALYGILKAGGAYVPIDPSNPKERTVFMLEDSAVGVLLTQTRFLAELPSSRITVLCLDDAAHKARFQDEPEDNLVGGAGPEHLAYMIYTSGSTGKPKGALNTHRGICNRILWLQETYRLGEDDRVLQKTPFSFDVSLGEFFWPLLAGARVIVAQPNSQLDSAYLMDTIVTHEITTIHFVSSILALFLADSNVARCVSLRRVICGGEALSYDVKERFFARLNASLYHHYGPTETAVDVTAWVCERGGPERPVPIGRPIANTQIYITDSRLHPVPIGVPGELHIGGVQVGRGYHNHPGLTAEKFIADPFSTVPEARLYKTGDWARYRSDGAIEYLGRLDYQVKIRGFRVELGEIETVIKGYPGVRDAVVVSREDGAAGTRLVAYIVCDETMPEVAKALPAYLRRQLPSYMAPAIIVPLESLPHNANGKLDRHALPAPQWTRENAVAPYIEPRNATERHLAAVWREILGMEPIGVGDNFFDLGGHSLLATQVLSRIQQFTGVTLSLRAFFENPTIAGLTMLLNEAHPRTPDTIASDRIAPLPSIDADALLETVHDLPASEIDTLLDTLMEEKGMFE